MMRLAARRPAVGSLHVDLRRVIIAGIGAAHVKGHRNVRSKRLLDVHGRLRADEMLGSVNVALEGHSFLLDGANARQRKHLESAAVCKNRLMPIHEVVQPARFSDQLLARAQVQVIRVAEQNLRADLFHFPGRHGLHRGRRAHRHINRRLNIAVGRMQHAQPCAGLLANVLQFIGKPVVQWKTPLFLQKGFHAAAQAA